MTTRFRTLPQREKPARVDREQRVIYGVSAAQAVEALGHGMMLDAKTLQQIVDLGNAAKNGIKSRFTHPGLSSDGMGKHLGRMKNFRVEGDKAVGDLFLAEVASNAPDGDLAGYVMDLAEEDGAAFGMSVVIEAQQVWTFADGHEEPAFTNDTEGYGYKPPEGALTKLPVVRVDKLDAVDVVDEPAANRDGLFSAALWGTNARAEQFFGDFDSVLAHMGMTPEQAWSYALRYFEARRVDLKGLSMHDELTVGVLQDEEILVAVEIENESEGDEVTQDEAKELQAKLAAFEQREREALAQAAQLAAQVEAMEREARTARFAALAAQWQGEPAKHLAVLEALGEGTEPFAAYCTHMAALSEQIATGKLFGEMGGQPQTSGKGAAEQLEAEAKRLQSNNPQWTYAQAYDAALKANPALYQQYRQEQE